MRMHFTLTMGASFRLALILLLPAFAIAKDQTLVILPGDLELEGPEARQKLLVTWMTEAGECQGQLQNPQFVSQDLTVAVVEDGFVVPRGDGTTSISVTDAEGKKATIQVSVRDYEETWQWSFRNHVLPVMARAGCNSGACHGALAGKGGFQLSLLGYDPKADHHRITREALGRRIEAANPDASLLLTKPTLMVRHKGGELIKMGSRDYQILHDWISTGAIPPQDEDPSLVALRVLPELSSLEPGATQDLLVQAEYSDGKVEDVTQWAKFSSANEAVVQVDEDGSATVVGYGEGAISVWFSSLLETARVTAPYGYEIPDAVFVQAPRRNFIDDATLLQLRRLNLKPSPRSSDATFLRRAYLDTIGVLPTSAEVRAFLANPSSDKRDRVIDELLARPEFVDYWTYKWSDVLLVNGRLLRPQAVKAYYSWLRERVAENTPWDEMVRQIVTAKGGSIENGATNFFAVHQDPETIAENVSQAFMSLSINCAKCHNHPLEKWTNDQYYAFANLFSRVRAKGWGGGRRNGDGLRTLYVADRGELIQPTTGKPQPPAPLDGEPLAFDAEGDRRAYLADWLTAPENPYFGRAIVNRVWANFLGVGLVEEVDDLRVSNPASNEALLRALADYLVEQEFDLKALMRVILQSETYQRSSKALPENEAETRFYSRYYPRRLMAEKLHDAIVAVSEVPTDFTQVLFPGGDVQKTDFYEPGTRALELFDSAVDSYFLKTFGRNERAITCECERSNQPSMVQVLHLANGDTVNEKLGHEESRLTALLESGLSDVELIEEAYLLTVSRYPTKDEQAAFAEIFASAPSSDRRAVLED